MEKISNKVFYMFILLLPICSLGYNTNIFRGYSLNASIYPFVIGIFLTIIEILISKKTIILSRPAAEATRQLIYYYFFAVINTLLMGVILSFYVKQYKGQFPLYKMIGRLFPVLVLLIIFYVIYSIRDKNILTKTIKIIYISFFIVVLYGYVQILSYYTQISIFKIVYIKISNLIDFGWMFDKPWNYVLLTGRINLTTPEPSEASHILNVLYYPFLLSALANKMSMFNKKIIGLSVELILFALSLPIIIFTYSSSSYFFCTIQIVVALIVYLANEKNILRVILKAVIAISSIGLIMFTFIKVIDNRVLNNLTFYLKKVTEVSNGSSNTRYALMSSAFKVFLKYPINGVGWNNTGFFMRDNLPTWSLFNKDIINEFDPANLASFPIGPGNIDLLSTTGIIGFALFTSVFYFIYKYLKLLSKKNILFKYYFTAFILYCFGYILNGFNNGIFGFMFQWVVLALFIAVINVFYRKNSE